MTTAGTPLLSKVAPVSLSFWIIKICATTLGETGGDLLSMTLHVGYAVSSLILVSLFLVALGAQLAVKAFHPTLFWCVVLLTSTAGTTMSDFMDRSLQLGYARGAAILFTVLTAILLAWRGTLGSLSVSSIRSRRAEAFYWAAILCSNTLGTALGDFLADDSGLGFLGGALLIAAALALVVVALYCTTMSRVLLFWIAFVLTRPFGATFGDLLTKPTAKGGFDLGTGGSSLVLFLLLAAFVGYAEYRRRRPQPLA